jgi:hypothetical protein
MPKYSFITCVSRPDVYDQCTLSSIKNIRKNHEIEVIPIINNDNRYTASIALNIGIDVSRSEYLIIAHQDIDFIGNDWLIKLDNIIAALDDDWAIIGSAGIALQYGEDDIGKWGGALNTDTVAVGSVYDGIGSDPYWNGLKPTQLVHCIDECVFVLKKSTYLRFDTMLNGFHFYGVDICLQARAAGYGVYGADLPITHFGKYSASFSTDTNYWKFFRFVHEKWHRRFPVLYGTHMHWNSDGLVSYIPVAMEDDFGHRIDLISVGISKLKIKRGDRDA